MKAMPSKRDIDNAVRLLSGAKQTHIAREQGVSQTTIRNRYLRVFAVIDNMAADGRLPAPPSEPPRPDEPSDTRWKIECTPEEWEEKVRQEAAYTESFDAWIPRFKSYREERKKWLLACLETLGKLAPTHPCCPTCGQRINQTPES